MSRRSFLKEEASSIFVVRPGRASISSYCKALRLQDENSAWLLLAKAIASSPGWNDLSEVTLVVRPGSEPLIGILAGVSQPWQRAWIEAQSRTLQTALSRILYLDYRAVERSVERLADKMIRQYGWEEIRRFHYTAIPRGGFIVLGMLAMVLDLPYTQITGAGCANSPMVIVDDCALSGARFASFLSTCLSNHVIFAHLYSHPQLRIAIEAREPRVLACLASSDLEDHAPRRLAERYDEIQRLWLERLASHRYWLGDPDRICFPWNEPERLVWNPVRQSVETGWKIVPPERCLQGMGISTTKARVEVQPVGRGPLRPSGRSLFGHLGKETCIANLETGESFRLEGSGTDIWWALVEHGTREAAVKALSEEYQVEESTLQTDVASFTKRLLAAGLLEEQARAEPEG